MVDGEGSCAYCWIFNKENKSKSLVSWIVRDQVCLGIDERI